MVQCGSCQVPTTVQAFRNWWMKYRSSIAKVWLWASLVGVSVGFGFLWTYCNPPNFEGGACNPGTTNPECAPCGLVTHWLGNGLTIIIRNKLIYYDQGSKIGVIFEDAGHFRKCGSLSKMRVVFQINF